MPWSGGTFTPTNGMFQGDTLWTQAAAANENVRADRFDSFSGDLALALNNVLTRDGQNAPSSDLPMGGHQHTNVADATDRAHYAAYGQVLDKTGEFVAPADVGGTGDAITLTPTVAVTALTAGLAYWFVAKTLNTGAVTVAVSGLAAVAIAKRGSTGLAAGDLPVGMLALIIYDGTQFQLVNASPGPPHEALSQTAYDALTTPGATTFYFITG